jgi:hypothetical protein
VGEDDDAGGHALLVMKARMWWISSVF